MAPPIAAESGTSSVSTFAPKTDAIVSRIPFERLAPPVTRMTSNAPIQRVRSNMLRICPRTTDTTFSASLAAFQSKSASMPVAGWIGVISSSKYGNALRPQPPACSNAPSSKKSYPQPTMARTFSRASEPFLKQASDMKPPDGFPKTWPKPSGSVLNVGMAAKNVSLVPSDMTATPGLSAPTPTRDAGLSPVNAATGIPGLSPYFAKYGARAPARPLPTAGSFAARAGDMKPHISASQRQLERSRRFIPAPSPTSIGASAPMRSEQMKELTRWMRLVAANASGSSAANFMICGPVKRSIAGEPVRARSASPNLASSAATCAWVEESIHIGATGRASAPASASGRLAGACAADARPARAASHLPFR